MTESSVAALLAARIFRRVEWLGLPPDELTRLALYVERRERKQQLAKSLRRMVGGTALPPSLADEIETVLEAAMYDPLRLVLLGAEAKREHVGHLYPLDIFHVGQATTTTTTERTLLADAHLHSGASLGFETLINLLISAQSIDTEKIRNIVTFDQIDTPFSLGVIVCGLRHFYQAMTSSSELLPPDFPVGLVKPYLDGSYWKMVRDLSLAEVTKARAGKDHVTWEEMSAFGATERNHLDPISQIRAHIRDTADRGYPRTRLNCLGLVGALFLINSFLQSEPGEGLPSFVDRFEQMGVLRDASVSDERSASVRAAADFTFRSESVVAAEFRKSIHANSRNTSVDLRFKVIRSLADHLSGFSTSPAVERIGRRLSMPVTFLRSSDIEDRWDEDLSLVHDIASAWRLAAAIVEARSLSIDISYYINSVDVVGDELSMPNWTFVPLFEYLRSEIGGSLNICCHAGESFSWPIQGIRSVGELLLPTRVVDRIGHALALDPATAAQIVGDDEVVYRRRAVIDDLCWMIASRLLVNQAGDLLDRLIGESNLASRGVTVEHLVQGWQDRRSIYRYEEYKLGGSLSDPPVPVAETAASIASGRYLAFLLLTHRGNRFPWNVLDRELGPALSDQYRRLNSDSAAVLADHVMHELARQEVIIESCPTSNMRLAKIGQVRYLPIKKWQERGILVSLNSDDPIIFGTSIVDEAELIERSFGHSVMDSLADVSVRSCCCNDGSGVVSIGQLRDVAARLSGLVEI